MIDNAEELAKQVEALESVVVTKEEIDFMKRKCYYIPNWFYPYLKGFRFKREWVKEVQFYDGPLG